MTNCMRAIKLNNSSGCCGFSRHRCTVIIAILEVLIYLCSLGLLGYAYWTFPAWKNSSFLVWLEVDGVQDFALLASINVLILLNGIGFFLSLFLLDGVIHVKLGSIRFWMTYMFTYKIMTCILVAGMEFSGSKAPRLSTLILINVFCNFIQILFIYGFFLEEKHRRRVQATRFKQFLLDRKCRELLPDKCHSRGASSSSTTSVTSSSRKPMDYKTFTTFTT